MDKIQKLIGTLTVERTRTYKVLIVGTWDMDNPLAGDDAKAADVILRPNGDGSYYIVTTRGSHSGVNIPAEIMHTLFGR